MENKYALCLTHSEDVDGIVSAVLLNIYLKSDVNFRFIPYSKQLAMFKEILEDESLGLRYGYRDVIVCDQSANSYLLEKPDMVLERLTKQAKEMIWIDHHIGTGQHSETLSKMGIELVYTDSGLCTSKLVYDHFDLNDEYASWLVSLAQCHDFPPDEPGEYTEIAKMLQIVISLANSREDSIQTKGELLGLVKMLANAPEWRDKQRLMFGYCHLLAEYHFKVGKAKRLLKESQFQIEENSRTFLAVFAEALLPQKDIGRELREKFQGQVDGILILFSTPVNNVLFFKDRESDFDALPFCQYMGGGGREGDGGFSLGEELRQGNYIDNVIMIREKLKQFFEREN